LILAILFLITRRFEARIKRFWRDARHGLLAIKDPWQLAALVAGSVLFTVLVSASLFAAIQAVGATLSLADIFTLYILSAFIGIIAPTPGGIGGTEAALIAGLTALDMSVSTAVSITLLFRLMTFWVPLIPSGIALHFFRKHVSL
jgi:uncharacterized protein (TIRG00374 family)